MIEKIEIRNFGNHQKLNVEFDNITTIVGSSYAGKSTVIRALRWIALNKPAGDQFINWDAEKAVAMVRVTFDDGQQVIRKKGKAINIYKLKTKNGSKKYSAFGNDVPPTIARMFNMSDLNFQGCRNLGQHEPPFWFCETAGEVSRQLNAIINLDVIDRTQSNLASELRRANISIDIVRERLDKAVKNKKNFVYIKTANSEFIQIESFNSRIQKNARIYATIDELKKLGSKYVLDRENAKFERLDAKNALCIGSEWEEIGIKLKSLSKLVESAKTLKREIDAKPPSTKQLKELGQKLNDILQIKSRLRNLISEAKSKKELKCQMEEDAVIFKKELGKLADQNCPLCGRPMKK